MGPYPSAYSYRLQTIRGCSYAVSELGEILSWGKDLGPDPVKGGIENGKAECLTIWSGFLVSLFRVWEPQGAWSGLYASGTSKVVGPEIRRTPLRY